MCEFPTKLLSLECIFDSPPMLGKSLLKKNSIFSDFSTLIWFLTIFRQIFDNYSVLYEFSTVIWMNFHWIFTSARISDELSILIRIWTKKTKLSEFSINNWYSTNIRCWANFRHSFRLSELSTNFQCQINFWQMLKNFRCWESFWQTFNAERISTSFQFLVSFQQNWVNLYMSIRELVKFQRSFDVVSSRQKLDFSWNLDKKSILSQFLTNIRCWINFC